jgi:hypothetical protein
MAAKKAAKGSEKYDNTNRGVLFANDKEGNENRPDYTGRINVDGEDRRIAGWLKESGKVGQFISIRVDEAE